VLRGFWLFSKVSDVTGTDERDLDGGEDPAGPALVVGCSHPGENHRGGRSNRASTASSGGFHLVDVSDAEVSGIVTRFRDKWKFERVAAGHCSGEFASSEFNRVFEGKFDRAGVGTVIALSR